MYDTVLGASKKMRMAPARFARTFLAGNEARSNSKQQLNINEQRTRGSLVLLGRRLCPFPF